MSESASQTAATVDITAVRAAARACRKPCSPLKEALLDAIQKTHSRRAVSWRDAFVAALNESRAALELQNTAERYSYKVIEPACLS